MVPVLFTVFGFPISSFGVMVALAFLAGTALTTRAFDDAGLEREAPWRILTWCMIGGVVGAKLWFSAEQVLRFEDAGFWASFFSRAGMTWYGGLIGGIALGVIGVRREGISVRVAFDQTAPALAVAHAIGRIGCLLVGDDYGSKTDLPWAIAFPEGAPPTLDPVHPTMVYETLWLLPVAGWLWSRRRSSPFLFGEYLFLAGLGRLWIEHFRTNPAVLGPLSNAQLVALLCMVGGAAGWLWLRRAPLSQAES
jgi:phosphatidylglycerol:prolipoprotein diacylglycerol transferase